MGYSPWGRKESDMTERLTHTHTLVKAGHRVSLVQWEGNNFAP